ncbi:hypothetical protein S83_047782, partial [Arachis hypogaea]
AHGSYLGVTRFATSTTVATKPSLGGLLRWLTRESSSPLPLLGTLFEGVAFPDPLPDLVEPSKTNITTLHNGLKIALETSP